SPSSSVLRHWNVPDVLKIQLLGNIAGSVPIVILAVVLVLRGALGATIREVAGPAVGANGVRPCVSDIQKQIVPYWMAYPNLKGIPIQCHLGDRRHDRAVALVGSIDIGKNRRVVNVWVKVIRRV